MEIIGRIINHAQVCMVKKNNRKVVSFTIALNDYYKPKNPEKRITLTTYIDCSYWLTSSIAKYLLRGTLVGVHGRIYATAYTGKNGITKTVINCHVNSSKIHAHTKSNPKSENIGTEATEDLPF